MDFAAQIVVAQAAPAAEVPGEGQVLETVGVDETEAATGFPPFESTYFASELFWLAICFVVLYLLLARVILPRIGGILEDRRDRIARDLDQAERLKQQSDDALAAYERALAEARSGAYAIAAEARDAAKAEADERQAATEAELDKKLAEAGTRIDEIKAKALADVSDIASDAAEAVVQRLLGKKPTAAELRTAVEAAEATNA
jgi:F-type H+-transporting ATPase subunit b